jgi:hypothetical protein
MDIKFPLYEVQFVGGQSKYMNPERVRQVFRAMDPPVSLTGNIIECKETDGSLLVGKIDPEELQEITSRKED